MICQYWGGKVTNQNHFVTSTDGGRTYRDFTAVLVGTTSNGFPTSAGAAQMILSPHYATDHMIYLQTSSGVYGGTLASGRFLPVDPRADNIGEVPRLAPFLDPTTGRLAFTYVSLFAHDPLNSNARIDPPLGHQPIAGAAPNLTYAFLMPAFDPLQRRQMLAEQQRTFRSSYPSAHGPRRRPPA